MSISKQAGVIDANVPIEANAGINMLVSDYEVSANSTTEQTVHTEVHTFCALTLVKMQALDPGTNKWCHIRPNLNGTWTLGARGGSADVTCGAHCF